MVGTTCHPPRRGPGVSPVLSTLLPSGCSGQRFSLWDGTGRPVLLLMCFIVRLCTEGGDASGWTSMGTLATPPTPGSQARDSFLDGELLVKALAHLRPSHSSDLKGVLGSQPPFFQEFLVCMQTGSPLSQ